MLTRSLDLAEPLAGVARGGPAGLTFTESLPLGGAFVLDALMLVKVLRRIDWWVMIPNQVSICHLTPPCFPSSAHQFAD